MLWPQLLHSISNCVVWVFVILYMFGLLSSLGCLVSLSLKKWYSLQFSILYLKNLPLKGFFYLLKLPNQDGEEVTYSQDTSLSILTGNKNSWFFQGFSCTFVNCSFTTQHKIDWAHWGNTPSTNVPSRGFSYQSSKQF